VSARFQGLGARGLAPTSRQIVGDQKSVFPPELDLAFRVIHYYQDAATFKFIRGRVTKSYQTLRDASLFSQRDGPPQI